MKLTSYWLDTSQPFNSGSFTPLEGRHGVAVVGGGLTRSSAALALATKGARVAILGDVMDGRPDLNPWKDFNWPAIPDISGVPGSCRSSVPITA